MNQTFQTIQELVESLGDLKEKECLVWFDDTSFSSMHYAEFADLSRKIALGLKKSDLGPGKRVVLFAENRWQTLVLAAGILGSGATVVPLDPQFSGDTLRHVLIDADPSLILCTQPQLDAVNDVLDDSHIPVLFTDSEEKDSWKSLLQEHAGQADRAGPRDIAALFYTSGTTGKPKGVPLSHANLVFEQNALMATGFVSSTDRMLVPLPLHHVYPFVVGMVFSLAMGLCVILPRSLTGPEIIRGVRQGRASIILGIPRLYEALFSAVMNRMRSLGFFSRSLALGLFALCRFFRRRLGLRVGKLLLRRLHSQFGINLDIMASGGAPLDQDLAWNLETLGWRVAIGYGLTETSPILSLNPPGAGHFYSVGTPLPGVELRTEKSGRNSPGDESETGEIQARGPNVFQEYWNLPQKSQKSFTPDGWFKTGDLGSLRDNRLVITGRVSTLIVTSGGENVQPDSVEQELDKHPLVRESGVLEHEGKIAVLAVPDLVGAKQQGVDPEEAARRGIREASKSLPSYQRPSTVAVSMESLDRTRLGKIQRHKLKEHFDQALKGETGRDVQPLSVHEMSTRDRRLLDNPSAAAVWDLLAGRYPKRRLTPDSDLTGDLGIDSLEWVDLSFELSRRAGVNLEEKHMASVNTVRDLLRVIGELEEDERSQIDPVEEPEQYLSDDDKRYLEPLSRGKRTLYCFFHKVLGVPARALFRIKIQGLEHVKAYDAPLVITPNHLSVLDPILLAAVLPFSFLENTHFIGAQEIAFANGLVSFFSRTAQTIPIDPGKRPGTGLALGAAVLDRNRNLIWFPEGMRSKDGRLMRFQPGLGRILEKRDAYVLPVRITGTYEAMPAGRRWFKPVPVTFTFGKPVTARELRQKGTCETPAECITASLYTRLKQMEERQ